MKQISFILILLMTISCTRDRIVTSKISTPERYYLQVHYGRIYVDSIEYHKYIQLGNNGYIIPKEYYLIVNHDKKIKVDKYHYDKAKRLDTL